MTQRGGGQTVSQAAAAALPSPDRQLNLLRQDYPGWDITVEDGQWTARLRRPLTSDLARAGISAVITAPTAAELAARLGREVMRFQAVRQAAHQ
ncbi:hypothetical protein [Nonomuraea endophytica]|uniref:hypothetical protein n=1 Tax=Nonomuraea endophytica TaxID=714136 RepID=UPI0037C5B325